MGTQSVGHIARVSSYEYRLFDFELSASRMRLYVPIEIHCNALTYLYIPVVRSIEKLMPRPHEVLLIIRN